MGKKVIIVGGGLAGLSSAVELLDLGYEVTLLEAKSVLGGRTSSWVENDMQVESGLHRVFGFYHHLPQLLLKCGIDYNYIVEWLNEFKVVLPNGEDATFAFAPISKPAKTLHSFWGDGKFLSTGEKLSLVKFMVSGLVDYFVRPGKLDSYTVRDYADKHNLTQNLLTKVLVPFTEGVFFLPPDRFSAFVLFSLVGPYLPYLYRMKEGAFTGGMSEVMCEPIGNFITDAGGDVRRSDEVSHLLTDDSGFVIGVSGTESVVEDDHVVLAVGLGAAKRILAASKIDPLHFKTLFQLQTMPAVTLQLEMPSPALPSDIVYFSPTTTLAAYAEQSRTTFKRNSGRLSIILGHPDAYLNLSNEDIFVRVRNEAAKVDLDLSSATSYQVISHPQDFYSLTPGSERLRPAQKTTVPGLTLAGDYTKQRYLATMEGAVYSGKLAASIVNKRFQSQ